MRIPEAIFDEMVAHARADAPDECCGIIGTRDGEAVAIHRAENVHHSPLKYEIGSQELYRISMALDDEDLEVGIIYHSHTRSDPYPSQTDVNLAKYPDAMYVIVGLAAPEPEVRAFLIRDGDIADAELEVI
ncbi:MAG TPA: M67 family metallopeptidase [Solirubrobacteraceae bacterium]|jgi:proteasome lid subunit RPN8/RPN11